MKLAARFRTTFDDLDGLFLKVIPKLMKLIEAVRKRQLDVDLAVSVYWR